MNSSSAINAKFTMSDTRIRSNGEYVCIADPSMTTSLFYFRSRCGYYMIACSLDGTVAFCEFGVEEIGKVMSDEDKVQSINALLTV